MSTEQKAQTPTLKQIVASSIPNLGVEEKKTIVNDYVSNSLQKYNTILSFYSRTEDEIKADFQGEEPPSKEIIDEITKTTNKQVADLKLLEAKLKNDKYMEYFVTQILYTSSFIHVVSQLILDIDIIVNPSNVEAKTYIDAFFKEFLLISKNDDTHTLLMKEFFFSELKLSDILDLEEFKANYSALYVTEEDSPELVERKNNIIFNFESLFTAALKHYRLSYKENKKESFDKFYV